ncbi:MAG: hypothetical protein AB7H97_08200 [Pseudobdellovibrionaceae bacterium]
MSGKIVFSFCIGTLVILFLSGQAFAQAKKSAVASSASPAGGKANTEFTLWSSPLLSQSIKGFEKITTLHGFTYGTRGANFYEFSGNFAYLKDRNYSSLSFAMRDESALENFATLYYLGADLLTYNADGESRVTTVGAHFGGGVQIHVGYSIWFRPDIKFQFGPGYSVLLGLGLVYK